MYRSKSYRVRPLSEIIKEVKSSALFFERMGSSPRRIFLCDGDALGAPMDVLVPTLKQINLSFPNLDRIGIYATAENMLEKSKEELKELASLKLNMAYLGMESGNDKVLHMIVKGNTASEMLEGSLKIKECGFKLSTIAMLGVGGVKHSKNHVIDTAKIIGQSSPEFFSFLSTVAVPGTPYHRMAQRNSFQMLTSKQLLVEMRDILQNITPLKNRIIFRANHVSNQFPLGGTLPDSSLKLIETLNQWIDETPEGVYPPIPQSM